MASSRQDSVKKLMSKGLQHSSYGFVVSLIIYWENGTPGFKEEGEKLGCFFRDRLGYDVRYFAIPRVDSNIRLLCFIANAIKEINDQMEALGCPALIILHYGGHGDSYDDYRIGQQEQSVWAEQEKGPATVKWFEIQGHLQYAKSDVLLILDCCFALRASQPQLSPQSEANPIQSYQLLAASSHREPTPLPGKRSFTNALLRRLKEHFPEDYRSHDRPLAITDLIRNIQTIQEPSLLIPPLHHSFTNGTIVIEPISKRKSQKMESESRWAGDTLTLTIRTHRELTKNDTIRLARQMTLDSPLIKDAVLREISCSENPQSITKPNDASSASITPNRAIWNCEKSILERDKTPLGYRYGETSNLRDESTTTDPTLAYVNQEMFGKLLSKQDQQILASSNKDDVVNKISNL
ncbi:hypothetical protein AOQ84DRAFT_392174 [Glonium stellatum]|uniref:Peptidase C14 caspase domain-containing protein n=1 Tax=Glonium stellatum TaxID=574774 RepID=A0A8E2ERJ2_9PEZI|nr:hypothetical protein AOQ84DRAFT_392174 [Glonium stellatum]